MNYQHIAYVSLAVAPPTKEQIDALLLRARSINQELDITGVLLCAKNTFFQFFEGTSENVEVVYERIKKSSLHQNIIELSNHYGDKRYFESFSMGFCYVPNTEIQALAQAEWLAVDKSFNYNPHQSIGIKMLEEYRSSMSIKNDFL